MKNTIVTLVPLTAEDREQFILDNQWSFKYGALREFGERDDHIDVTARLSHAVPSSATSMIRRAKPIALSQTAERWAG